MTSIKIFVEGGGETNADGRGELRVAFDALIGAQKEAARKKRMRWDTVFCGGRSETADEFAKAVKRKDVTSSCSWSTRRMKSRLQRPRAPRLPSA